MAQEGLADELPIPGHGAEGDGGKAARLGEILGLGQGLACGQHDQGMIPLDHPVENDVVQRIGGEVLDLGLDLKAPRLVRGAGGKDRGIAQLARRQDKLGADRLRAKLARIRAQRIKARIQIGGIERHVPKGQPSLWASDHSLDGFKAEQQGEIWLHVLHLPQENPSTSHRPARRPPYSRNPPMESKSPAP